MITCSIPPFPKTTNVGASSRKLLLLLVAAENHDLKTQFTVVFPLYTLLFDFIEWGRQTGAVHGRKTEREQPKEAIKPWPSAEPPSGAT